VSQKTQLKKREWRKKGEKVTELLNPKRESFRRSEGERKEIDYAYRFHEKGLVPLTEKRVRGEPGERSLGGSSGGVFTRMGETP